MEANGVITFNRSTEISYNIIPMGHIQENVSGIISKNSGGFIERNSIYGNIESNTINSVTGIFGNTGAMEITNNRVFEGIYNNTFVGEPPIRGAINGIYHNTARTINSNRLSEAIANNTLCGRINNNGLIDGSYPASIGYIYGNIIFGRIDTDADKASKISNNYSTNIIDNVCQGISFNSYSLF